MDAPEQTTPASHKPTIAEVLESLQQTQNALADLIGRDRSTESSSGPRLA